MSAREIIWCNRREAFYCGPSLRRYIHDCLQSLHSVDSSHRNLLTLQATQPCRNLFCGKCKKYGAAGMCGMHRGQVQKKWFLSFCDITKHTILLLFSRKTHRTGLCSTNVITYGRHIRMHTSGPRSSPPASKESHGGPPMQLLPTGNVLRVKYTLPRDRRGR